MGKVVKAVVGVVTTVVGVVTGNPALIIQGVSMTFSAVTEKKPKAATSQAAQQRLSKSLTPEVPRKIVLGKTALPTDLRYWEVYGAKFTNYVEVMAAATHKINSFGNLYIDDVLVPFSGTSATGKYAGSLKRYTKTEGLTGQGMPLGSGSRWGTSASMTGCAYWVLDWAWTQEKLANGIPSRYTQEGEGSPVYDPRRDSTRGGSGPHRVDNQATWEYSPLDSNGQPIGRNNALQMLRILIGWRVTSPQTGLKVLVDGRGVNYDDINYPSFIEAANNCELERWYSDCVLSTGDSHSTNEGILEGAAGGKLSDTGGRWSYRVATNDTANVATSLTDDDFEGLQFEWKPRRPMSDQFNEIAGTYIDPAALYQARPFPLIFSSDYYAEDGFKKRTTVALSAVQDSAQAQKLMRIKLNAQRRQGVFRATFNWKPLLAENLDCVTLTFAPLGFVNKLFRIIEMGLTPNGVDLTLQEEDASIYAGGVVVPYAPPSQGANYDSSMKIDVGAVVFTAWGISGSGGQAQDAARLVWTTAPENVRYTEARYRVNGTTPWTPWGPVGRDTNTMIIGPLLANTSYDFEVRHVSVDGVPGDWSPVGGVTNSVTRNAAGQIVYADGTPIDSLKPGEAGANVTETRTSAAIVGQGSLATQSSVTEAQMQAAGVANAVVDPDFTRDAATWTSQVVGGTSPLTASVTLDTWELGLTGTPAVGEQIRAFQKSNFGLAVVPGQRIEASFYVGGARWSSLAVRVHFLDANLASAGQTQAGAVTSYGDGANYDSSNMTRVGGFVTAPAGAKTAFIVVYATASGVANPSLRMKKPVLAPALSGQTDLRPYSPGFRGVPGADPTLQNTSAGFVGQGALATQNIVTEAQMAATGSMNGVTDSEFQKVNTCWSQRFNSTGLTASYSVGNRCWVTEFTGTPAGGSRFQVLQDAAYSMAVRPGQRIEAAAFVAGGALSSIQVRVQFWDENLNPLTSITAGFISSGIPSGANYTVTNMARVGGFVTAPADGSLYASIVIYAYVSGAANPYLRFKQPLIAPALSGQTDLRPYSPGFLGQPGADPTLTNTAAGFVGQGALATQSSVAWASQVTGATKPEDSATKTYVYRSQTAPVSPGVNDIWVVLNGSNVPIAIRAWNGSAWVVGADLTSVNSAASIAGQGPGATAAAADVLNNALFGPNVNRVYFSEFDKGTTGWFMETGNVGGGAFFVGLNTYPYIRYQWNATSGQNARIAQPNAYAFSCAQGERLSVQARIQAASSVPSLISQTTLYINWLDSSNASVGNTTIYNNGAGAVATQDVSAFVTVPSGAVKGRIIARIIMGSGSAPDTNLLMYRPFVSSANASQTIHPPYSPGPSNVPGSDITGDNVASGVVGQTVWATTSEPIGKISRLRSNGRLLNSYAITNGVLTGATLNRSPVYILGSSVNGSAARMNISAFSLTGAGISASYNAGTIDGLSFSTAYYVWAYDPDMVGGAVTYVATTNPNTYITNSDYLFLDAITTVSSSGGSGTAPPPPTRPPGGDVDCVSELAWLPTHDAPIRARDLEPGDTILMLARSGDRVEHGTCEANRRALAHCMIFETVSGVRLTCSTTTPIVYQVEGGYGAKPAWECDGTEIVPVIDDQGFRWEPLARQPGHIGEKVVAHISANDGVYAAGDQPGRFMFTHNLQPIYTVKA